MITGVVLADLTEDAITDPPPLDGIQLPATLTYLQRLWREHGYLILRGLIDNEPIDAYCARFLADHHTPDQLAAGYGIGTPYLRNKQMRDVVMCARVGGVLTELFGEPLGLHLNLTGWRSTQRGWHTDRYLNPPCVGDWYAATWMALGDVGEDCGPFEFVAGSHRWPRITRDRMLAALGEDGTDPDWPWRSERLLGPMFEAEFVARGVAPTQFHADKGDVLIWHANLVHRGSTPTNPQLQRRTLISHWSAVSKRCDMPPAKQYRSEHAAGWYFPLDRLSD